MRLPCDYASHGCPYCAETVKRAAIVCKHCRLLLTATAAEGRIEGPVVQVLSNGSEIQGDCTRGVFEHAMFRLGPDREWGFFENLSQPRIQQSVEEVRAGMATFCTRTLP